MKLTKKEAKKLSLLKWDWFRKHPENHDIEDLPEKIRSKVKRFLGECPLCNIFIKFPTGYDPNRCEGCPLNVECSCFDPKSSWFLWRNGIFTKENAEWIYFQIKNWKV